MKCYQDASQTFLILLNNLHFKCSLPLFLHIYIHVSAMLFLVQKIEFGILLSNNLFFFLVVYKSPRMGFPLNWRPRDDDKM